MTAERSCTALRATVPHGTPEPNANGSTKRSAKNRLFICSPDPLRNLLQKPSQISIATNRSHKPSRELCPTNLFGGRLSGGKTRLTCTDVDVPCESGKGVAIAASGRYRFINPRASRHIQGAIR